MLGLAVATALPNRIRTVAYVEREAYAASTLVARMDDATLDTAPVWDDVHSITGPDFSDFVDQVHRPLCITAGYPCQPFSLAGKRSGENDPRHLWPAIARFVGSHKPELCFFENVPGHLNLGFERVCTDLEAMGYRVAAGLFSAQEVGAAHKRERLFILAVAKNDIGRCISSGSEQESRKWRRMPAIRGDHMGYSEHGQRYPWSDSAGRAPRERPATANRTLADPDKRDCARWPIIESLEPEGRDAADWAGEMLAHAKSTGRKRPDATGHSATKRRAPEYGRIPLFAPPPNYTEAWTKILAARPDVEPAICRTSDGLAHRLDRLRLTGNGVCTLAACYAFLSLAAACTSSDEGKQ